MVFERGDGDVTLVQRGYRTSRDGRTLIGNEEAPGANGQIGQWIVACAIGGTCHALTEGARGVPSGDDSRVFFLRPSERGSPFRELWSVERAGKNERHHGGLGPFLVGAIHYDVSVRDQIVWTTIHLGDSRIWLTEFK